MTSGQGMVHPPESLCVLEPFPWKQRGNEAAPAVHGAESGNGCEIRNKRNKLQLTLRIINYTQPNPCGASEGARCEVRELGAETGYFKEVFCNFLLISAIPPTILPKPDKT